MKDSEGVPMEKMIMIGDNLHTDIRLGANAKIDTCLVLTGVTPSAEHVLEQIEINSEVKAPTYIMQGFALSEDFLNKQKWSQVNLFIHN